VVGPLYAATVGLDAARDGIVGAWKLFGYEDRETESDPWTPTFGRSPSGIPFRIVGDQLTLGDGRTSRRLLTRVS
jgi:hypothetical protein